ncbi:MULTISPECIES: hypothetical protein [Gammaproteobacteria]|uniref:hypothetical protein n=1 Tax=Gammaproteobacteria TaxID=1236 RepID=UPI000DD0E410|nr:MULTISPECIES: hypothetical protein [Gammaproteobacteria]RTE86485.1 hypothetical protein DQX04_07980 [Aliidiomarina sp. B3213]TCZ90960.1 hypothetical protein EYQ95_09065 [Lysobacter sp. N42]
MKYLVLVGALMLALVSFNTSANEQSETLVSNASALTVDANENVTALAVSESELMELENAALTEEELQEVEGGQNSEMAVFPAIYIGVVAVAIIAVAAL